MFISSKSKSLGFLLAAALILGSVACSTSGDKQASEQVGDDYEYVYVDENGNQVDPKSVHSDEYEVVDGEDVPASEEVSDLNDSVSDAEDAVASDDTAGEEEATDDELKEMLANINDGKDSLGQAPAPAPAEANVPAAPSSKRAASGKDEYVSLDDEASAPAETAANTDSSPTAAGENRGDAYVVVRGDTLSEIAQRLTGSFRTWPALAQKNNLSNPNLIFPGNKIFHDGIATAAVKGRAHPAPGPMPKGPYVEVQPGETLANVAARVYGDANKWRSLAKLNSSNIPDPNYVRAGQKVVYSEEMAANKPAEATTPAEATPTDQTVSEPATEATTPAAAETVSEPAAAEPAAEQTSDQPTDTKEDTTSH